MAIDIKLGSYVFGNEISDFEVEEDSRVDQVAVPRRDGFLSDEAYRSGMKIRLSGLICEDTDTEARAAINNLRNAFGKGKKNLTLYNDRQAEVQRSYFSYRYVDGDMRRIEWEGELVSDDFGFVSTSPTEQEETINANPETNIFTNNGNLETSAIIRITAGGANIATGLRIDNLTNAKFFTINQQIDAGDWVEIDTDLLTVVDQSGANVLAAFQGDFFKLEPGDNSIKWTGTATSSPLLKFTYRDKYDGA